MIVTTLVECKEGKDIVAKDTKGVVVGNQWGDKGDGYVIDFPQVSRMFVLRENVVVTEDKNAKSCSQEEERKGGKSKWKKELPPPTVGKGSVDN